MSYGPTTHHTFADNGSYTGVLTVTDAAGNASSRNFSVNITKGSPSVTAPPDTTSAWGVPVRFHADVFDPGPADQQTLQVQWDFGDGTGAAGIDVAHTYATPGTYGVTLKVVDKDGASGAARLAAKVVRRSTAVGMLGDSTATYDTPAAYGASLTDQFGNAVAGRTVALRRPTVEPRTIWFRHIASTALTMSARDASLSRYPRAPAFIAAITAASSSTRVRTSTAI